MTASHKNDHGDEESLWRMFAESTQLLPGAGFALQQYERVETAVLRQLKRRMARIDPPLDYENGHHQVDASPAVNGGVPNRPATLAERMARLMERAGDQTREQALQTLFLRAIDELVPDEARIIGVLSDGEVYPLVHVGAGPRVGATTRRLADNFSTIGKPAGVKLHDRVPDYIAHLRRLGLVETGPEDKSLEIKYQILESEQAIKKVVDSAAVGKTGTIRLIRRTLRLSDFGLEFWKACQPQ